MKKLTKLKKFPLLYKINARIKAWRNKQRLMGLYKFYEKKAKELNISALVSNEVERRVREKLVKRGVTMTKKEKGKLRIFYLGASEPQDASGFLQALKSYGEVVTCSNTESGYSLKSTHGLSCEDELRIVRENSDFLVEMVSAAHRESALNLFMGQIWADTLSIDALKKIQELGIPTVNISMDDKLPALWGSRCGRRVGSVGLKDGLDLVLTTSPDTCLWYAVEGVPAVYWPLASDPHVFYPRESKPYDVVFIGSNYGMRGELVRTLISEGVKVEAFGPGWPNGSINASQMGEVSGKAKIMLGTGTIGYNEDIFTIKLRDFDAPMSGALYLTHRNPDLLKLFEEGKEIACYSTVKECVEKAKYYLSHEEECERVARAGLEKVRNNFTWDKNISGILRYVGLLE